jgi:hypothetical protein
LNENKREITKGITYHETEDLYEYQSHTNRQQEYLVKCDDRINRKDWTCTCKGFMFRKDPDKICKHIERIKFIDAAKHKIDELMPQKKGLIKP